MMDPLAATRCAMALAGNARAQIEAIRTGTAALAGAVRNGTIEKQTIVDAIFEQAENIGLTDTVGAGAVHIAIAQGLNQVNGGGGEDNEKEFDWKPWWRDPKTILHREWLYKRHYIRGYVSATVGAGGRAKTTQSHYEACAMACGFDLKTRKVLPEGPLRVLCLNAEETQDELDRRTAALCLRYKVTEKDLGGRLIMVSVREKPLRVAYLDQGKPVLDTKVLGRLQRFIERYKADVFVLDPLVSFHGVVENTNEHMDLVIKEGLGGIASKTNSAGEILHHPGKTKPGQGETSVEDGRGASAIIFAARSARVFNFMSQEEAAKFGITEELRVRHVRFGTGKANMGATGGKPEWFKIEIETLPNESEKFPNGDEIAVASPWEPPNPFEGVSTANMMTARQLAGTSDFRADSRSPKWFGYALAEMLKIHVTHGEKNSRHDMARLNAIIKKWCENKVLKIDVRKDEESKERKFIVPGSFVPTPETDLFFSDDDE